MNLSKLDLHPFILLTRIETRSGSSGSKLLISDGNELNKASNKFQCYFCEKSINQSKNIAPHLRIHTKEGPYKCSVCNNRFSYLNILKQHFQAVHKKERFECPKCSLKLITRQGFKTHLAHHDKSLNKCQRCQKCYSNKSSLKRHIDIVHNGVVHNCHICQRSFTEKSHLKIHINNVHNKIRNFMCSFCPKGFATKFTLNGHMNAKHFKQKDLTKCPESGCNLTFISQHAAWDHRVKYHPRDDEVDKLKCKTCHKTFASKRCLSGHEKTVHGFNYSRIKCTLCPKMYTRNFSLQQHITSEHTAEKSFRCDWYGCHKDFALQYQLKNHKRQHLDKELGIKYPCDECPSVFKLRKSMCEHKRSKHKLR